MTRYITTVAAMALAGTAAISAAQAQDIKLPTTMAFTAYDTGTSGFNIAVGVGKMMKDKYGTDVRVLPAGNDVARLAPLRAKRAAASAMGSGTYFAQEGVFEVRVTATVTTKIKDKTVFLVECKQAGIFEVRNIPEDQMGAVIGIACPRRSRGGG